MPKLSPHQTYKLEIELPRLLGSLKYRRLESIALRAANAAKELNLPLKTVSRHLKVSYSSARRAQEAESKGRPAGRIGRPHILGASQEQELEDHFVKSSKENIHRPRSEFKSKVSPLYKILPIKNSITMSI